MIKDPQQNELPGDNPNPETPSDALTPKQRRFVEEYCIDFNATRAAIAAGYSEASAANIGWENVRKRDVSEAINARLAHLTMSSEEAAVRLTRYGRGSLIPFVDENGYVVLDSDSAQQNLDLVRKIKQTKRVERNPDGVPVADIISTEIEINDPLNAIDKMLQYHGKYVKKVEMAGPGGGPIPMEDLTQVSDDELRNRAAALRSRIDQQAAGEK